MARRSTNDSTKLRGKLRLGSMLMVGQVAMIARDHWQQLPAADRARAVELVKQSRLRPSGLTPDQRAELVALFKQADFKRLSRDLAPLAARRAVPGKKFRG